VNIHKILYKVILDPFGEIARNQEEDKQVRILKIAEARENILSVALNNGEPVQEELDKIRVQIIDLTKRLPRGDNRSFYAFCIWCIITIPIFVSAYVAFSKALDSPYDTGLSIAGLVWAALIATFLVLFVWLVQKRLQRRHAKRFITIVAVLMIGVMFVLICSTDIVINSGALMKGAD
jgi:hypothetical protein